ncbi:MAG: ChbG/HpnK family deacetylase [Actinomycetota bacterium]
MRQPAVTLCADDYGLAPGVGEAIRALIASGRLQATGCMCASPFWPAEAALLKPLDGHAHVGVHLTLTDHRPLGPMPRLAPAGRLPPLGALLKAALLGRVDAAEIAAELERQVDAFEAHFGRPPDFLDGHHHVHQLPGVREAAIDLWRRRLPGGWVRSCWESPAAILARGVDPVRATVIALLGWRFRRLLSAAGVPHNRSFRGVYDLTDRIPYDLLFGRFTQAPGPATLVMCHPGLVDDALKACEHVTTQREVEYRFLASDQMALDLAARGVSLQLLRP